MNDLGKKAQLIKDKLAALVDEDTNAFNAIMDSNKLSAKTDEEARLKNIALKNANEHAFETPFLIASLCADVVDLCITLSLKGNPNSVSDIGVAVESAYAGFKGASLNVLINMPGIDNKNLRNRISEDLKNKKKKIEKSYKLAIDNVNKVMASL